MEMYKEILEKIAKKELSATVIWVTVLFVIIGAIWLSNYLYFKSMKNNYPRKYNSEKGRKVRCQSAWASIALTVICIGLGALLYFDTASTVLDINKDIEENTYITYDGGYYISDVSYHSWYTPYDNWLLVDFDNDDCAFIHVNSFFEWISTEVGQFEGKVVYGKNSLIVVDIE